MGNSEIRANSVSPVTEQPAFLDGSRIQHKCGMNIGYRAHHGAGIHMMSSWLAHAPAVEQVTGKTCEVQFQGIMSHEHVHLNRK